MQLVHIHIDNSQIHHSNLFFYFPILPVPDKGNGSTHIVRILSFPVIIICIHTESGVPHVHACFLLPAAIPPEPPSTLHNWWLTLSTPPFKNSSFTFPTIRELNFLETSSAGLNDKDYSGSPDKQEELNTQVETWRKAFFLNCF